MVPACGVGLGLATPSVVTSAGAEGLAELWSTDAQSLLSRVLKVLGPT